jgi:hypothetical protein
MGLTLAEFSQFGAFQDFPRPNHDAVGAAGGFGNLPEGRGGVGGDVARNDLPGSSGQGVCHVGQKYLLLSWHTSTPFLGNFLGADTVSFLTENTP